MNELVKRLSETDHRVVLNRPDLSARALEERIRLKLVHVLFEETGTELGIRLDQGNCDYRNADFNLGTGNVLLQGALTLNGDKVRCVVNVDLDSMKGIGRLESINDTEYKQIVNQ